MRTPMIPAFRLRFPIEEVPVWADRYSYADDADVESIGKEAGRRGWYTADEFLAVAQWKTRGRSHHLCEMNTEAAVRDATAGALATRDERERVIALVHLHGVQLPTASVLLHLARPRLYPIIDFRALWSLGVDMPPAFYSFPFWWAYTQACRSLAAQAGVSMRRFDRALWQYSKLNQPSATVARGGADLARGPRAARPTTYKFREGAMPAKFRTDIYLPLIEAAIGGHKIVYSALPGRGRPGGPLFRIARYEHAHHRPPLTALAVHKRTGRPGDGFPIAMAQVGYNARQFGHCSRRDRGGSRAGSRHVQPGPRRSERRHGRGLGAPIDGGRVMRSPAGSMVALAWSVLACSGPGISPGPPDASIGEPSAVWSRITEIERPADPGNSVNVMSDVIFFDGRMIAVGASAADAAAWTSDTGATWARAPSSGEFDPAGGPGMNAIAKHGSMLVAVGPGDATTAVWTSTDGIVWTFTYRTKPPDDSAPGSFEGAMAAVASDGSQLVAVGLNLPGAVDDFGGGAWTSPDAQTWSAVPPDPHLLRAPLYDVVAGGPGFVAVGGVRGAVVLTSTDGRQWLLHDLAAGASPSPFGDVVFQSVTAGADGRLVAVGYGPGGAAAATSPDGVAWTIAPCSAALEAASMYDVVTVASGFVAVGYAVVADTAVPAVWRSADGLDWTRVTLPDLGTGQPVAVTATPAGLVMVGSDGIGGSGGSKVAAWLGPPDGQGDHDIEAGGPCTR